MSSKDIEYTGTPRDYDPDKGNRFDVKSPSRPLYQGYHNLKRLKEMLSLLMETTKALSDECESYLEKFNVKVEPGTQLYDAHMTEWPDHIIESKDYVSYLEYKALRDINTRGAEYIRRTYADYVRGPNGTNALDILIGINTIRNETINIGEFIDVTFGDELVASEQYRTSELLQDWAEKALEYTRIFGELYAKRRTQEPSIPESELGSLTEKRATEYQAIFKIKVNAANDEILRLEEDIRKDYDLLSKHYYAKFLGPSIQFRKKISTPLQRDLLGGSTFLDRQAQGAISSLDANISSLLGDQMVRNEAFEVKLFGLLSRINERDNYVSHMETLATVGKKLKNAFANVELKEDEKEAFDTYVDELRSAVEEDNKFRSQHDALLDRENDEAHPQYLLKAGDTITGDIAMKEGVKLDGMRPGLHRHRGIEIDGTSKIRGEDIEDLITTAIDRNEAICQPINLRHINNTPFTGSNNVTLVNSQIAWDCDPNMTFELQVVPVDRKAKQPSQQITYCVTTLYETGLDIVAGLGSDFNFFTYATQTAVYNYNWTTGSNTLIAGIEGVYGDSTGDSLVVARFADITDIAQDYADGRVYIADGTSRKIKMTGKATPGGHALPMDIKTVYTSFYSIKRIDTQPQNFLNTLYVVEGPDANGRDRVMRLYDNDGNQQQAGTYATEELTKISGVYTNIKDIAVTPSGMVYLLRENSLIQYYHPDQAVKVINISEGDATPTAITADHENNILITYTGEAQG